MNPVSYPSNFMIPFDDELSFLGNVDCMDLEPDSFVNVVPTRTPPTEIELMNLMFEQMERLKKMNEILKQKKMLLDLSHQQLQIKYDFLLQSQHIADSKDNNFSQKFHQTNDTDATRLSETALFVMQQNNFNNDVSKNDASGPSQKKKRKID